MSVTTLNCHTTCVQLLRVESIASPVVRDGESALHCTAVDYGVFDVHKVQFS